MFWDQEPANQIANGTEWQYSIQSWGFGGSVESAQEPECIIPPEMFLVDPYLL